MGSLGSNDKANLREQDQPEIIVSLNRQSRYRVASGDWISGTYLYIIFPVIFITGNNGFGVNPIKLALNYLFSDSYISFVNFF